MGGLDEDERQDRADELIALDTELASLAPIGDGSGTERGRSHR